VPAAVTAAVFARDGGCVAREVVEVRCWGPLAPHHTWRKGQGGPDEAWNLVTLCAAHHTWVHAYGRRGIVKERGWLRSPPPRGLADPTGIG
jgi:hypothetical protein